MTTTPEAAVPSTTAPARPNRLFAALGAGALTDPAQLSEIYEQPSEHARRKQVDRLHEVAQRLIACSPLVFVASSDAAGRCDVSPRGGPAGLVSVLDEYTLAIPDATGNKRLDTLHNIVETGRVGLLFVVPGRDTTLRVNGRACVSTDPELLRQLTAVGKPPRSAIVVAVEEVYGHCPKAFLRASAWKPENWLAADAQPSSAEVTLSHLRDDALTIELIEQTEREALLYRYE
ncbi:MSMEG_1061 family FMN-dependent PPOX-type flavoprotein [Streptomyces sp. FH025]|uniref:MSMEG_1061 family FMN-dependent PPOX-type flavoprotein n=1 Tax=Streptomyces sp. FH025 TaxID=2815937 RepID=UPI001A9F6852|nr:MSMEG_1061 family FMN-dependent PPOX-type flavoprotein [Streptomyces sp. FH025]MBO1415847.1 pyridoxamine 5'-phosphate oxidase family protein [Streptomyces sp. FH025]